MPFDTHNSLHVDEKTDIIGPMTVPTEVWVAAVPTFGVCLTGIVTFLTTRQERSFRLDVDAHERVLNLMALAHGRLDSGKSVGLAEQIGALYLLQSLARGQERIRPAVIGFTEQVMTWNHAPAAIELAAVAKKVNATLQAL